jgi:WD40 repeat protein
VGVTSLAASLAWSPNGQQIAVGYDDGTVHIWEAANRWIRSITVFRGQAGQINAVTAIAWSHDGTRLATVSPDRFLRIWDANTGSKLSVFSISKDVGTRAIAWNPDDTRIAVGGKNTTVIIVQAPLPPMPTSSSGATATRQPTGSTDQNHTP